MHCVKVHFSVQNLVWYEMPGNGVKVQDSFFFKEKNS